MFRIIRIALLFALALPFMAGNSQADEADNKLTGSIVYTEPKARSFKQMINLAGSQRMLSQRIVKLYCQVGLGVFSRDSYLSILDDADRFENQHRILKNASDNVIYQEMLEWVSIAWARFKPLVTAPVSRENLLRINHLAEDLLYTSNQITMMLQDSANQREEMLVNIAGRQRMLAQRLGKLYMMKSWGFDLLSINNELARTESAFDGALESLRSAPESNEQILADLEEVVVQWIWFQSVLERKGEPSYRLIVADASDSLLKMMDDITVQYAAMKN